MKERKMIAWLIGGLAAAALICVVVFTLNRNCKVTFSLGYVSEEKAPETQVLKKGGTANEPTDPKRAGYIFIGWYTEKCTSIPYNFKTQVKKNLKLTAKWIDTTDTADTDGDGLTDSTETQIGTDIHKSDTDSDGLSDYTEFVILGLDPLLKDTDGNGIPDGEEDSDGDRLSNAEEEEYGTNPIFTDTDFDGLSDYSELMIYKTLPMDADTDQDGASDGREVLAGTDPLVKKETFVTVRESGSLSEMEPVALRVSAETDAEGIGSLTVEPVISTNIPALTAASYGYLGSAYELYTEGNLSKATLTFTYDPSLGELSETFMPRIYWYDETENELVELPDQIVEDGKVTAETMHFSTYTLMNKYFVDLVRSKMFGEGDITTDSNNDGISDYFIELISSGQLLYDNTDILVDVLGMYGADLDDWDGDGLLNGEEISVVPTILGGLKIKIISNPILVDSDFDGISDFTEVKQTKTDPLRYDRRSLYALDSLENDIKYSYAMHEGDWRSNIAAFADSAVNFFTYSRYDRAKEALIDYFYDYAPEETVAKNAELIERQTNYEEALKIFGAISNVAKALKDVCSVAEVGAKNAALNESYLESITDRKMIIDNINYKYVKGETVYDELKLITNAEELQKATDDILSDDTYKQIEGVTEIISRASTALSVYQSACELHVYTLAREFRDFTDTTGALEYAVELPSASGNISVICNIVDAEKELLEVRGTYGKLRANADAYNMYTELLLYIRDRAQDSFVKAAAADVAKMVLDQSGAEYFIQLSAACGKKLTAAAAKAALDTAAKENAVLTIIKGFMEAYKFTGTEEMVKYEVYFAVMSEISKGSRALLDSKIKKSLETFAYAAEDSAWVEKYLVQLAQSRIVGEYYWYEYCADQSGAAWIIGMYSKTKPEDYRDMFSRKAEEIYGYANRLKLRLSKNLPHYDDFWSDQVPEDEITIPGGKMIAARVEPTEEAVLAVYMDVLEKQRPAILDYSWGGRKGTKQLPSLINFKDITGDGLPEMIYAAADAEKSAAEPGLVADLHILSYRKGYVYEIMDITWDYAAGGGVGYVLFTCAGDCSLHALIIQGDAWYEETFSTARENELQTYEFMEGASLRRWEYGAAAGGYVEQGETQYSLDGVTSSEAEYESRKREILDSIDEVLMASRYDYRELSTAFTYAEAMDYLVSKTDPDARKQDMSAWVGEWDNLMNTSLRIREAGEGYIVFDFSFYRLFGSETITAYMNGEGKASFYEYKKFGGGDLYFENGSIRFVLDRHDIKWSYLTPQYEPYAYEHILERVITR